MIASSLFAIDPERWFPAVPADPVPDTAVLWRPHPSDRGGRCTKILKNAASTILFAQSWAHAHIVATV